MDFGQQGGAGDPGRRLRPGREDPTQVAQSGRPEDRVADGMQRDIPVRVTVQARRSLDDDAAQGETIPRPERV